MMSDDQIIAVVQAHKEGKKIEWVGRFEADKDINWRHDPNPKWNFEHLVYRVALEPPKPREWRVCVNSNGNIFQVKHQDPHCCIIVREVIGASSGNPTVDSDSGSSIP